MVSLLLEPIGRDSSMWWSGGLLDVTVRAGHAEPGHSSPNSPILLHTVGHTGVPTASTVPLRALPTQAMSLETPVVSGAQGKAERCRKTHPEDRSCLLQPQKPREARVLRLRSHANFWSGACSGVVRPCPLTHLPKSSPRTAPTPTPGSPHAYNCPPQSGVLTRCSDVVQAPSDR